MSWINITEAERLIVAARLVNGPYKTEGTEFSYSPGAGDEIITKANALLNDTVDDFWDGDLDTPTGLDSYTLRKGHYVLGCAYYYLLTGTATYGAKAKAAILAQVNSSNPDFSGYTTFPLGSNIFHFSAFSTRILVAYDYCKDLFSAAETTQVTDWFDAQYDMWKGDIEYYPKACFPNRDTRDYSVTDGYAATPTLYTHPTDAGRSWTYKDANGDYQNRIYHLHLQWYNAMAYESVWMAHYGALKNDNSILDWTKIWFEEYLKYATFPDGSTGESNRNNSYDRPQTGSMHYETIVLECAIIVADLLARRGDFNLYNFATNDGLQGSEGGAKSIRNNIKHKIESCNGSVLRYYETVDAANLLDTLHSPENYRYKPEPMMGLANLWYGDILLTYTYTLDNATNDYQYAKIGIPSVVDSNWVGAVAARADIVLSTYEIDGSGIWDTVLQGSKSLLL